ncbi:MAG: zinc ribbon domain-containing protein, partial [Gemmatimonadota bacterium]|nr:zinc ribbon domain-containing protein [Gemmatimonadota bacterium]
EGQATASDLGVEPANADIFSDAPGPADLLAAANGASDMANEPVEFVEVGQDPGDEAAPTDDESASAEESDPTLRGSARPPLEPEYVEAQAEVPDEAGPGEGACVWCRADLPDRDNLNFCPYCGTDVTLIPCPACGEEVEAGWRFCIACGTEVRD